MALSLNDLAKRLDKLPKEIKIAASTAAIVASKRLLERLWADTPVDTSKALSNWLVGLGSPSKYSREAYVPGFAGYTATASTAAARMVAFSVLDKKKPGQTIFIANNVDYIIRLNEGYSRQAPAGYIENAIFIVKYTMRSYKLNIRI